MKDRFEHKVEQALTKLHKQVESLSQRIDILEEDSEESTLSTFFKDMAEERAKHDAADAAEARKQLCCAEDEDFDEDDEEPVISIKVISAEDFIKSMDNDHTRNFEEMLAKTKKTVEKRLANIHELKQDEIHFLADLKAILDGI